MAARKSTKATRRAGASRGAAEPIERLFAPPPARTRRVAVTESAVYDGGRLLGRIVGRQGAQRATTATGAKLGIFRTGREAMRAICAAARAAEAHA